LGSRSADNFMLLPFMAIFIGSMALSRMERVSGLKEKADYWDRGHAGKEVTEFPVRSQQFQPLVEHAPNPVLQVFVAGHFSQEIRG
jgi:hypothetical protein